MCTINWIFRCPWHRYQTHCSIPFIERPFYMFPSVKWTFCPPQSGGPFCLRFWLFCFGCPLNPLFKLRRISRISQIFFVRFCFEDVKSFGTLFPISKDRRWTFMGDVSFGSSFLSWIRQFRLHNSGVNLNLSREILLYDRKYSPCLSPNISTGIRIQESIWFDRTRNFLLSLYHLSPFPSFILYFLSETISWTV